MTINEATEQAYKNGYEKGKADALKWIPVTERLPTPYIPVLACKQPLGGQPPFMAVDYITIGYGETKIWVGDIGTWKNEVTHWMPLPEPPRGA